MHSNAFEPHVPVFDLYVCASRQEISHAVVAVGSEGQVKGSLAVDRLRVSSQVKTQQDHHHCIAFSSTSSSPPPQLTPAKLLSAPPTKFASNKHITLRFIKALKNPLEAANRSMSTTNCA
jgi:hypothetical protein